MADTAYVLTKDDLERLKDSLAYVDSLRRNKSRSQDSYDSSSPEVYVARVPAGGIPALTTGATLDNDMPSKTVCNIYQILPDEVNGTTPEMMVVDSTTVEVYNVFATAVSGNTWVPVARDKFGTWVVTGMPQATAASTASTYFFSWDLLKYIANPGIYPSAPAYILPVGKTVTGIAWITVAIQNPPGAFELATALVSAPLSYLTVGNVMSTPDTPRPGTGINTTSLSGSIDISAFINSADSLGFYAPTSGSYTAPTIWRVDAIIYY